MPSLNRTLTLHLRQQFRLVVFKVNNPLLSIGIKEKVISQMDVLVTSTTLLTRSWSNFRWLKVSTKLIIAISKHLNRSIRPRCANISLNNQIALSKSIASLLMVLKNSDSQTMHFLWTLDRHRSEPVYRTTRLLLANSGNKPVSASLELIAHSIMERKIVAVL